MNQSRVTGSRMWRSQTEGAISTKKNVNVPDATLKKKPMPVNEKPQCPLIGVHREVQDYYVLGIKQGFLPPSPLLSSNDDTWHPF